MKDMYTVQRIIGKKITQNNGQVLYKVKWENYPESQSTWQPLKNLRCVQDMVEEFEARNERKLPQNLRMNHTNKNKQGDNGKQKNAKDQQKSYRNSQPRKLVKKSENADRNEKYGEQEQGNTSQLQKYFLIQGGQNRPVAPIVEDGVLSEINLPFLQARIKQLVREKEEKQAPMRILEMFKGENGFIYKVEQGGKVRMVTRQFIVANSIDELIAFYESQIQFQQRSD